MALRFVDSFDHYATADITKKWTAHSQMTIVAGGRYGAGFLRSTNWNWWISKTLDSQATWVVGFAIRVNEHPVGGDRPIVALYDSTILHVDLRCTPSGTLRATRNGTSLGLGTTVLSLNTWYYIEVKVTIADSPNGAFAVRVNGNSELNLTSQDTRNGGNASADIIRLVDAGGSQTSNIDYDDVYICDGTGGTNNDFLGDVRIEALLPSGAGNSAQFTPSAGSNYQNVDDASIDGDSTYNYSNTSGHIDSFAMNNLTPTTGTVLGVQTVLGARKDDAGTVSLKPHFRISSTNYARTTVNLNDSYRFHMAIEETNPAGGNWDISTVNGLEFGYKIP